MAGQTRLGKADRFVSAPFRPRNGWVISDRVSADSTKHANEHKPTRRHHTNAIHTKRTALCPHLSPSGNHDDRRPRACRRRRASVGSLSGFRGRVSWPFEKADTFMSAPCPATRSFSCDIRRACQEVWTQHNPRVVLAEHCTGTARMRGVRLRGDLRPKSLGPSEDRGKVASIDRVQEENRKGAPKK
jgi:hypothetical protein